MSTSADNTRPAFRHFLGITKLPEGAIEWLIARAIEQKRRFTETGELERSLEGKTLAMLFQKPSLRTRLGFEVAMTQLGGHAICLDDHQAGLGTRESLDDAAKVIASMCDGIMARVFDHAAVESLATHSSVPVINGLSDFSHPCQAMTDLMTLQEHFGRLEGLRVAYVGDGNNMARSLAVGCVRSGAAFAIATPTGHCLEDSLVERLRSVGGERAVEVADGPQAAAQGADVLYTDVWTSMGQEEEAEVRRARFAGFQINADLLRLANPSAVVLHCLPAHRDEEITEEVLNGPQSLVFIQAENRLHFQRTLLDVLMRG